MIAVLFAMEEEAELAKRALLERFSMRTKIIDLLVGKVNGKGVMYVVTGIGKTNAACATALVVSEPNIDLVVNVGVCGALRSSLRMLDVVCVERSGYYDVDVTKFGYQYGQVPGKEPVFYESSAKHVEQIDRMLAEKEWYKGRAALATGDTFLIEETMDRFPALQQRDYDVVDMEGAACAHVASKNKTPFVAIKVVSDQVKSGNDNKAQHEDSARHWSERIAEVLELVLAKL